MCSYMASLTTRESSMYGLVPLLPMTMHHVGGRDLNLEPMSLHHFTVKKRSEQKKKKVTNVLYFLVLI